MFFSAFTLQSGSRDFFYLFFQIFNPFKNSDSNMNGFMSFNIEKLQKESLLNYDGLTITYKYVINKQVVL